MHFRHKKLASRFHIREVRSRNQSRTPSQVLVFSFFFDLPLWKVWQHHGNLKFSRQILLHVHWPCDNSGIILKAPFFHFRSLIPSRSTKVCPAGCQIFPRLPHPCSYNVTVTQYSQSPVLGLGRPTRGAVLIFSARWECIILLLMDKIQG